jgi:hypothetical protein
MVAGHPDTSITPCTKTRTLSRSWPAGPPCWTTAWSLPSGTSRTGCTICADEYIALQRVVHRVAKALAHWVPTERMYSISLGSQQGNAHLHWRIAPLPPGLPTNNRALSAEHGVLAVDGTSQAALAEAIRRRL